MADRAAPDVRTALARVRASVVAGAEAAGRAGELLATPSVHMLCADLADPYVGYVRCRPFDPGPDVASALSQLGALPAAVAATHVLFAWDVANVRAALDPARTAGGVGLAIVEATFTDHTADWLPAGERPGEWKPTHRYSGGRLPLPIVAALDRWRALAEYDVVGTTARLEMAGYWVRWASRHTAA